MSTEDFVPPQALDAEAGLLGCLMIDGSSWEVVEGEIAPEDFYSPLHAMVYAAMVMLRTKKMPVDKITLTEELRARGELQNIGGPQFLSVLMQEISTIATAKYYVKLIREKSLLRSAIAFGRKAQEIAFSGESDVDAAVAEIEKEFRAIIDRGKQKINIDRRGQVKALLDVVASAGERTDWLTSPWPTLDKLTGGFDAGELIVWVAAPKVGKSGVVLTLADHVARKHGPTVLFATEMSDTATRRRHMAQLSGVSARKQRYGSLSGEEWEEYFAAIAVSDEMPLHIFGRDICSLTTMRRALREVEREEGKIQSIIVDHVGFLSLDNQRKNESPHERMDKTYRALLDLAEEFHAPLHAVQHVNRSGYGGQQLTLASIRDGGNPEGHAHAIIGIHRPYPFGDAVVVAPNSDEARLVPDEQKQIGEFQILASRDGEAGVIPMRYIGHRNFWEERRKIASVHEMRRSAA